MAKIDFKELVSEIGFGDFRVPEKENSFGNNYLPREFRHPPRLQLCIFSHFASVLIHYPAALHLLHIIFLSFIVISSRI